MVIRRQIQYIVATSILALSGCSLAPRYQQPDLPVASKYPNHIATLSKAGNHPLASKIRWQNYFNDPYLRQLIGSALAHNRDLRTAVLRTSEAGSLYRIEGSNRFPFLNGDIDSAYSRTPGALSPTGKATVNEQYQTLLRVPAWELDFWGRIHNLTKASLENYLATDDARRAFTISLIAQVADQYLALRALDERIMLAKETMKSRQKTFDIFQKRFKVGAISKLELSQVETLLTQAESLYLQLERQRAETLHQLTFLVGSHLPALPKKRPFDDNIVIAQLHAGLPSDLLMTRPDIVAAEHRLKAAGANVGAARAAFFPQIRLTGGFGSASDDLIDLFKAGTSAWNFMPTVSIPIFNAGRNRAALSVAKLRHHIAIAQYEKTIQNAFREVSDALAARTWLTKQVAVNQRRVKAEKERLRLAQLSYDHGASPYLEVLDAQRDLLTAEQQLVEIRQALLASRVRLYETLGGGSQDLIPSSSQQTK